MSLLPPREEATGLMPDPGCIVEKIPPPKLFPGVEEFEGLSGVALVAGLDGKLKRPLPTVGAAVEAALLLVDAMG